MENFYIKVPNSLIDFASLFHESLSLSTFVYLKKSEGHYGDVNFSIDSMREALFFEKRRKRSYREDTLKALSLLSCTIKTSEETSFPKLMSIESGKRGKIFSEEFFSYGVDSIEKLSEKFKGVDGWYNTLLSANFTNNEESGFTTLTKKEYLTLLNGIFTLNKKLLLPRSSTNEWRGESSDLFLGYLIIKKIIQRNILLNKRVDNYNFQDKIPRTMFSLCMSSYSDREVRGILKELAETNMIKEETINKNKFYKLNFKLEDVILKGGKSNGQESESEEG